MLGWMSEQEALSQGFTHRGKYFGIPLYLGDIESEGIMVATKFAWMEPLMTVFHYIEGFLAGVFYPNEEPMFQFAVGDEIDKGEVHE